MPATLSRRQFLLGRPAGGRALARTTDACLELRGVVCQACRDACAARAVRFVPLPAGLSKPLIDPGRCTGCGDCVPACPAAAIAVEGRQ